MQRGRAGVTLIEMLLVVTIIAVIAAISFPSVSAGLEGLRLATASDSIVSFLNSGLNRAERRQEPVEIGISLAANSLDMRSADPSYVRTLKMPDGIKIDRIHPPIVGFEEEEKHRNFIVYPGGSVPRIGVELVTEKGVRRIVRVDPITGVAAIENIQKQ